jgi:3-oxoacyl-[acyl-carrier protein] reductase
MNAFVTGGSRGIGRSIVLRMVEKGYGCAFTYVGNEPAARETLALAKRVDPRAAVKAYQLDVSRSVDVERVAEEAIRAFGNIDVVVNNAGIVRDNAAVLMSDEEWDTVIATNLSGSFYVIRSFLMHFLSNRRGRIISISSVAQDGSSGQANYAASKAGLIGLTNTIAREYGSKGVTANIVVVGYVETDLTKDHLAEKLHAIWMQYCPMRRTGTAEEVASLVHYLTTDEAGFITGEVIHVSGGLTYIP